MSADLSQPSEQFIADAVSRGLFPSRNEAIEAGVELLRRRQQLLDHIDEGRRQLDEGDYVEFDEEGLKHFFEQLLQRAAGSPGEL